MLLSGLVQRFRPLSLLTLIATALLFFISPLTTSKASPSFSCKAKLSANERLICNRNDLQQLDNSIAHLYSEILVHADAVKTGAIKKAQERWLKNRQRCRNKYRCTLNAMQSRSALLGQQLQQIRNQQESGRPNITPNDGGSGGGNWGTPPGRSGGSNTHQCGWWAIHGCSANYNQAVNSQRRFGGKVISTNNFPGFRNGFFCAADGPSDKSTAKRNKISGGYIKHDGNCKNTSQSGAPGCAGGRWQGARCTCPSGTFYDAGSCRTQDHGGVNCASFGQAYYQGQCVARCPNGTYNNYGFCVARRP